MDLYPYQPLYDTTLTADGHNVAVVEPRKHTLRQRLKLAQIYLPYKTTLMMTMLALC